MNKDETINIVIDDYIQLYSIVKELELDEWVLCLPEYIEEKYLPQILSIYRSKRGKELTWLTIDRDFTIVWDDFFGTLAENKKINIADDLVIHYFLLCFFDISYDDKKSLFSDYLKKIPLILKRELKELIVSIINKYVSRNYNQIDISDNRSLTFTMNSLMREIDPSLMTPLYHYIQYSNDNELFFMIMSLSEAAFTIFIAIGSCTEKILLEPKELINFEESDKKKDRHLFMYLSHIKDFDFKYFDISVFEEIVIKYWEKYGCIFLRKFYNIYRKIEIQDYVEHKKSFSKIINKWYTEKQFNFIDYLKWPSDYSSLIQVLYPQEDNDSNIEYTKEFLQAINKSLIRKFKNITYEDLFREYFLPSKIIDNPTDREMFIAICLVSNAVLESNKKSFSEWIKVLKNILYNIKPLFYSGHEANRIASTLTDTLLVFVTSVGSLTGLSDLAYNNLKEILELIANLILYPYIRHSEGNEDIWNYDRMYLDDKRKNYQNKELYLINHQLRIIKESSDDKLLATFQSFFNIWRSNSSVKWPWYNE